MPVFRAGEVLLNNKLTIERLIGEGAFGEVYLAQHNHLNAPRALKVLRRGLPGVGSEVYQEYIDRFTLEARLGDSINDDHIIRVFDFEPDEPSQTHILQMEYAPGGNLKARLDANKQSGAQFEIESALRIARGIAAGLACLHKRDIVHRDLSPSNVLFDAHDRAKIADLGLAQIPGGPSRRSRTSSLQSHPGTPGYMSPEQESTGATLKPASDIYTLGLLLFEMLTGRNYSMCKPGTRLRSLRPDAPAGLDEILDRMLAENWRARPFDGEEAGALLQGELDRIVLEREQREAVERARQAAILAQREAEERARLEAETQAQREAETKAQREAAERARHVAIQAQRQAEERARLEAQAQARRAAEAKAQHTAAERAALEKKQHEAAQLALLEAQAQARREAEVKAQHAAAERAALENKQREAAQIALLETQARTRHEAEVKAQREAAERAAIEKKLQEAAARARRQEEMALARAAQPPRQRRLWLIWLAGGGAALLGLITLAVWMVSANAQNAGSKTPTPTETATPAITSSLTVTPTQTPTTTITTTLTPFATDTPVPTGFSAPTPTLQTYPTSTPGAVYYPPTFTPHPIYPTSAPPTKAPSTSTSAPPNPTNTVVVPPTSTSAPTSSGGDTATSGPPPTSMPTITDVP